MQYSTNKSNKCTILQDIPIPIAPQLCHKYTWSTTWPTNRLSHRPCKWFLYKKKFVTKETSLGFEPLMPVLLTRFPTGVPLLVHQPGTNMVVY